MSDGAEDFDSNKPWQQKMGSPPPVPFPKVSKDKQQNPGAVVDAIQKIQEQRNARRESAKLKHDKGMKAAAEAAAEEAGIAPGVKVEKSTVDFIRMIRAYRFDHGNETRRHADPSEHDICVVVRKRPINKRETSIGDYEAVTCLNPRVIVHAPKLKVDGITRYLENTTFQFDHTFGEEDTSQDVYAHTVQPLIGYAFQKRGRGTCFAYGQTGSGKTHTMSQIQQLAARDIFRALQSPQFRAMQLSVCVSFYEIYGGRAYDVLHERKSVKILENERNRIEAVGLQEVTCANEEELLDVIARGNATRKTASTEVNNTSSRSHAICDIALRTSRSDVWGSLSLIDLAGSERAASDSRNHNQTRRMESAEINKSLLGLKECIRALAQRARLGPDAAQHIHVPFRASKLTLALRDSFVSSNARVVMIATVSPNAASSDHTGNTLRYADRVKEHPAVGEGSVDEEEDMDGEGAGMGNRKPETTFTFLQEDAAGSGAAARALLPPRVSPVTVADSGSTGSGVITDSKVAPKNIFQRVAKVAPKSTEASVGSSITSGIAAGRSGAAPPFFSPSRRLEGAEGEAHDKEDPDSREKEAASRQRGMLSTAAVAAASGVVDRAGGLPMGSPTLGRLGPPQRVRVGRAGGSAEEDLHGEGVVNTETARQGSGAAAARHPRDAQVAQQQEKGRSADNTPSASDGRAAPVPMPVAAPPPSSPQRAQEPSQAHRSSGRRGAEAGAHSGAPGLPPTVPLDSAPPTGMRRLIQPRGALASGASPPAPVAAAAAQGQYESDGSMGSDVLPPKGLKDKFRERARRHTAGGIGERLADQAVPVPAPVAVPAQKAMNVPASALQLKAPTPVQRSERSSSKRDVAGVGGGSTRASAGSDEETDRLGYEAPPRMPPPPVASTGTGKARVNSDKAQVGPNPALSIGESTRGGKLQVAQAHISPQKQTQPRSGMGDGLSSPQRDVKLLHETLKRERHGSAGGGGAGLTGGAGSMNGHGMSQGEADIEGDALLALHEAVTLIVDEEQDLLEAHMHNIQEDAVLLTDEGKLLSSVQGRNGVDYDIGAYAAQLQGLLERKMDCTASLLRQVKVFRDHLRMEEQLSSKLGPAAMRGV